MRVSFAPLEGVAIAYLVNGTGTSFGDSFAPPRWFCCSCRDDEGYLMGVVTCEFRTGFEATFNLVVTDKRCISRRIMRAIFTALFSKAVRVTAEVATDNVVALKSVQRMGFVLEGYCRLGFNGVKDTFVYGMLRDDCRFLPGYAGGTTKTLPYPEIARSRAVERHN